MPKAFENCVDSGGRVRTMIGPNKRFALSGGEYVKICFLGKRMFRGHVHKRKRKK